jgi:hypothetical protein
VCTESFGFGVLQLNASGLLDGELAAVINSVSTESFGFGVLQMNALGLRAGEIAAVINSDKFKGFKGLSA